MSPKLAIFLECVLSFGLPLGWALRELYLLRRRRPPDDRFWLPEPRPLPPDFFGAPPPAPSQARRERVLEDA